jgi:hypothetical protein
MCEIQARKMQGYKMQAHKIQVYKMQAYKIHNQVKGLPRSVGLGAERAARSTRKQRPIWRSQIALLLVSS